MNTIKKKTSLKKKPRKTTKKVKTGKTAISAKPKLVAKTKLAKPKTAKNIKKTKVLKKKKLNLAEIIAEVHDKTVINQQRIRSLEHFSRNSGQHFRSQRNGQYPIIRK